MSDAMQIAVFAKPPVAGKAKTRLIPALGPEGAAQLHAELVDRTLETVVAAQLGPVTLWCAESPGHPFFDAMASRHGIERQCQQGADLGERMHRAFEHHCPAGPLLLIGTDCPALDAITLRAAAEALATHDAVFAPAEDGGYVLVGLNRPAKSVFETVPWGSDAVMARTRTLMREASIHWHELAPHWDIDRPEDLPRFHALATRLTPVTE